MSTRFALIALWMTFVVGSAEETTSMMPSPSTEVVENVTTPSTTNHSEILHAMPTEQTKMQHDVKIITPTPKAFRPSPQLETFFEYNRVPVPPAHPEAKHFETSIRIPVHSTLSHVIDADGGGGGGAWSAAKVRFPHTHPVTINDHPYPYLKDTVYGGHTLKRPLPFPPQQPVGDGWGDKTLKRKPPLKTYEEGGFNTDLTSSPWKKIIKLLTAFIPIGLLLSALTPNFITIGPMNTTAARARSDIRPKGNPFASLACDERVFCELMLSAEATEDNQQSVDAMLEHFVERHGNTTRLQHIYAAIQGGDCNALECGSMKA